jgi:hypothetical protein
LLCLRDLLRACCCDEKEKSGEGDWGSTHKRIRSDCHLMMVTQSVC